MKRALVVVGIVMALALALPLMHLALIEIGQEVVVLHSTGVDGEPLESRLWIVDHEGHGWLHGNPGSGWVDSLLANPSVEVERGGDTKRYRAVGVPGPHPEIDRLLREKYGVADRWVRFVVPDGPETLPIRLEPIDQDPS